MAKCSRKEKYIVKQIKNENVYFIVKFTYNTVNGTKTYTKCFSVSDYATQTECLNAACRHRDIKRAELAGAGFTEDKKLTVNECVDLFVAKKHMPASTKRLFFSNYKNYIEPTFGERSVASVTALEIEESLNLMRNEHSDQVIKRVFGIWKDIFSTARKLRAVRYNVTEEVEVPKSRFYPAEKTKKEVSDENIKKALEVLAHYSDRESSQFNATLISYIIVLCRQTGIRPAEAFALKRSNVDFAESIIHINCSYGTDENGRAVVATKTKTSVRDIPLTLAAELALRGAMAMSANEFIFTKWNGELFTATDVSNVLRSLEKNGVKRFSLYSLRHQFSSDMITSNVDPRTVMELMGHSSTEMSIEVYARSSDEKKRSALEELGRKS